MTRCRLPHKLICTLLNAVLFAPFSLAAVVEDIDGSRDLNFLQRYPESGIVRYSEQSDGSYIYGLGKVKRISGSWRAEEEGQARGAWINLTYRAPDRKSSQAVYEHFIQQFKALAVEPLYTCSGRACGPSNKWANDLFGEKQLYGPDANQRYFAGRMGNSVLTLYVIKRGNRRVYARLDHVVLASAEAGSQQPASRSEEKLGWLASLQQQQRAVILRYDAPALQQAQTELEQLAAWLLQDQARRLRIVGHQYGEQPLEELRSESRVAANRLSERLIALGVPPSQLEVFGLGPLAPGELGRNRIVLLLQW